LLDNDLMQWSDDKLYQPKILLYFWKSFKEKQNQVNLLTVNLHASVIVTQAILQNRSPDLVTRANKKKEVNYQIIILYLGNFSLQ